jgi:hypothetical protein
MKIRHKIGFGIYLIVAIMTLTYGFFYLFSSKMMPYHAQVIGKNWTELERGSQILIVGLMEVIGAGAITIGSITLILSFILFRHGERWVNRTIFFGGIVYSGLCFFATFKVYLITNASSPWPIMVIFMLLLLAGFACNLGIDKDINNRQ